MERLRKDLEKEGFNVGSYKIPEDGGLYVIDISGHPKQIGINRFISLDWYNLRESVRECMDYFSKVTKKSRYDVSI